MRKPPYLSPSSIGCFDKDPEEFYLKYLADNKPPRLEQTKPMSVGSAFDAEIKALLHTRLFGKPKTGYDRDTLFEAQVEPQNRDFAGPAGKHVLESYLRSKADVDLMLELETSLGEPTFEFDLAGEVDTTIGMVPIFGKPDLFYVNRYGARVILDFKVNGYCGRSAVSPAPGYVKCRDGWDYSLASPSRNVGSHKDCVLKSMNGVLMNVNSRLELVEPDWAKQTIMYNWMLGMAVGSMDHVCAIEQIVSNGKTLGDKPMLRIASHRLQVSEPYQYELLGRITNLWSRITSGHYFQDVSFEESEQRCAELEKRALNLKGDGTERDKLFSEFTRTQ